MMRPGMPMMGGLYQQMQYLRYGSAPQSTAHLKGDMGGMPQGSPYGIGAVPRGQSTDIPRQPFQKFQDRPGMPLSPQAGGIPFGMFNKSGGGAFTLNTEGIPKGGP